MAQRNSGLGSSDTKEKKAKQTRKTKVCFQCGIPGHLAKMCPKPSLISTSGTELKTHILPKTHILLKKINFKSAKDVEILKQRVKNFKDASRSHYHFKPELYKPILRDVLNYLIHISGSLNDCLPHPSQIKLAFTETFDNTYDVACFQFAESSSITGYITFSTFAIENELVDGGTESGYKGEDQWFKKLSQIQNKEEILFWILIHEFTHLFKNCDNNRHDDSFFEQVYGFAQEHMFLFQ